VGDPQTYFAFNIPWLLSLPIAGAAGAWMSWHGGGGTRQRALAAVFPHAAMLAWLVFIMLVIVPISLVVRMMMGAAPHISSGDLSVTVWAVRLYKLFTPWVIVPAIASMIGALPFLWLKPHTAEDHPVHAAHA
jgi:hypothetical protein